MAIAKPAKYIRTTGETNLAALLSMQFSLGLGKDIGSSIILHNYPPSQRFYFPAQFYSKITLCVFFFCTLHLNRASGRSWKKMPNFAGFSGTNSRKKRPISREFRWNFAGIFEASLLVRASRVISLESDWFCADLRNVFNETRRSYSIYSGFIPQYEIVLYK